MEKQILEHMAITRKEVATRRLLHNLRATLRLYAIRPDTDSNGVRAEMTDESVAVVAPLIEAYAILEAIVWASDGCVGHKHCAHSMEPWQRARALVMKVAQDEEDERFRR
jgi:hypothetical protein